MKSVQETSKQSPRRNFGRTDIRYWADAIFKPTYTKEGQRYETEEFAAKIQHAGRRETFALGTSNRANAAATAKEIYLWLKSHGWDPTVAKYKPKSGIAKISTATVGDFLAEVKNRSTARPKTIENYCRSFRKIVADIAGISGGAEKYDYKKGGNQKWVQKIEAVELAKITPNEVLRWKQSFLRRAGNDPVKQRAAKNSVNSILRQAKSLFAPSIIRFLPELPKPTPFEGVPFEPRQSMRYRCTFKIEDVVQLVHSGNSEHEIFPLPSEQKKIFFLAVMAGLRRNEIDKLEWSAFDWKSSTLRIQATEFFEPKSEESNGDIDLDPDVCAFFHAESRKSQGRFVIASEILPKPGVKYSHYRCQKNFEALAKWLRIAGIQSDKPLHDLRKEYGSQICARHGIYAASRALRHADIGITGQHYVDKKRTVTSGLGHLVRSPDSIIPFPTEPDTQFLRNAK